jgi:DNA helicase-2/ATP-dependent DNA helicase PcrA
MKAAVLNEEQESVASSSAPATVCVACPGSGKTTTLTESIARRMEAVDPSRIMAVTFTRLAAAQLRERLAGRCDGRRLTIGTFHAIAYDMVRQCWRQLEYASETIFILDRHEARKLLKEVIFTSRYSCTQTAVTSAIDHFATRGEWPQMARDVEGAVDLYLRAMRERNSIDYPSVSVLAYKCLAAGWLQGQWTDIFVDEAQDLDRLQHRIFRLLAPMRMMMVGDSDQLIYGWRGAEVDLMRRAVQEWHAEVHLLERNYRSRPFIVEAASNLIGHNQVRIPKVMRSCVEADDGRVRVVGPEEALALLGEPFEGTTAVLSRTHDVIQEVSCELARRNVPHRLIGRREKLLEREDVKDALAVLAFPSYPESTATMQRVMKLLGKSDYAVESVATDAKLNGRTLYDVAVDRSPDLQEIYAEDDGVITEQLAAIFSWLRKLNGGLLVQDEKDILAIVSDFVRHEPWARRDAGRLLAWINLRDGQDEVGDEPIQLMTVHAAKGLEFDRVVVVGLHDRVFPHKRSTTPENLEEERRLMFVAVTRAKHELVLCQDLDYPSRFIREVVGD